MRSTKALSPASLVCLLLALALSVPLLERLVAAGWQWYKFAGYSEHGHINLSRNTGWIYTICLGAVFVSALLLNRAANRGVAAKPAAWSRLAMYIAAVAMIVYWTLGMSNFNVWRP